MKKNKKQRAIMLSILPLSLMSFFSYSHANINSLSDGELRKVEGQGLMTLSYISPTDSQNQNTGSNIGFYKLGMEAQVDLNANIKKLQLGCGGVNGAGACDIDIDYLSLSGVADTSTGRASSSATITNPFIQFAIKNPNSASTREVSGFRLSAESIQGLLTFGLENGDAKSGINSFSGYMVTKDTTGTVSTGAVNSGLTQSALGKVITGMAKSSTGLITTNFRSTDYDLTLSAASGSLVLPSQVITGKRITSANLTGTATVSGIGLGGTIKADTDLGIGVSGNLSGTINNLGVNVTVNEDLGYFHKVNLNGTAASLSMQKQNLIWPDAKSTAQTGWWLELSNPIDIGDVSPLKTVDITKDVVSATLDQVSAYLGQKSHAVNCGILALSCVVAGKIDTGTVDLSNSASVPMGLTNLVLTNQTFAPNCYGNLKFC
ncbi:hypothetical protein [Acinetobacter ursingii]|uniref:hypothetical protein n=1 Tax=Acinetobacter ursingii TaxID=108980 RepID=UPI00124D6DF8|nr:hypothetical protein [Acinetobacter ursingii]